MANVPDEVGWITVSGKGLLALADSTDPDSRPDARPMNGEVILSAVDLDGPVVALTSSTIVPIGTITAGFLEGELRPPKNGEKGELDPEGALNIVAPLQDELSHVGWLWEAWVKPGADAGWPEFRIRFTGAPGETVDLAQELIRQIVSSPGTVLPPVWVVSGTTPPAAARPGQFLYDESSTGGDLYLIGA